MKKHQILAWGLAVSVCVAACAPTGGPTEVKPGENASSAKGDLPPFAEQGKSELPGINPDEVFKADAKSNEALALLDETTEGLPQATPASANYTADAVEELDPELDGSSLIARPASAGTVFVDANVDKLKFKLPNSWKVQKQSNGILSLTSGAAWGYVFTSEKWADLKGYTQAVQKAQTATGVEFGGGGDVSLGKSRSGVNYGTMWSWNKNKEGAWVYTQTYVFELGGGLYQGLVYKANYDTADKWKAPFPELANALQDIQVLKPEQNITPPAPPANNSTWAVKPFATATQKVNWFDSSLEFLTNWKVGGYKVTYLSLSEKYTFGEDNALTFYPREGVKITLQALPKNTNNKAQLESFTKSGAPTNAQQKIFNQGKLATGQEVYEASYTGTGDIRAGYLFVYPSAKYSLLAKVEFRVTSIDDAYLAQIEKDIAKYAEEIVTTASKLTWLNKSFRSPGSETWLIQKKQFRHFSKFSYYAALAQNNVFENITLNADYSSDNKVDFYSFRDYMKGVTQYPSEADLPPTPFEVWNDGNGLWYLVAATNEVRPLYFKITVDNNTGVYYLGNYGEGTKTL